MLSFAFTALPSSINDATPPAQVNTSWQHPITPNSQNTPTCSIDGYAGCIASLSLDMANQVNLRDLINCRSVQLTDRAASGNMTFDMTTLANKDFFALIKAGNLVPFSLTHGTESGKTMEITAPKVQLATLSRAEDNGITQATVDMRLTAENGNDEIIITAK